jgi:hypothetical protein
MNTRRRKMMIRSMLVYMESFKQITMAQQKLYTEEQVRIAIDIALNGINQYYTPIIDRIKPIELPSDEEIRMQTQFATNDFYWGAKWMKEQILNQIK